MVVGGLIKRRENDHLHQLISLALRLREVFSSLVVLESETENTSNTSTNGFEIRLDLRFGLDCGSIIAGIVGKKNFCLDIFGDVVNTSAR